jgi:predicted glycoside hydrolase/deacetylase ChbG (UPF0249 family)
MSNVEQGISNIKVSKLPGRSLVVVADDFGIGPATSRGILDLAATGRITGTVLLVNSPYAEEAVRAWRQAGADLEIGWHPCLTMDPPVLPATQVPSLVGPDGCLWPLGTFMRRVFTGRIRADEVEAELRAQLQRFCDLVGRPPSLVNSHQHVQLFHPVGDRLQQILSEERPLPYLRRIREPWSMIAQIPGARIKRTFLSTLGRRDAKRQDDIGFPGNDWLAGVTDPPCVTDARFLVRWLTRIPGDVVELTCHPGYWDPSLIGRDCTAHDGRLQRRVLEFQLLRHASFQDTCEQLGFTLVSPSELIPHGARRQEYAA